MSDQDLEVLVTLDDPWYGPDEDTFHTQSALPQESNLTWTESASPPSD